MVKVAAICKEIAHCADMTEKMDLALTACLKTGHPKHELTARITELLEHTRDEARGRWAQLEGAVSVAIPETLDDVLAVLTVVVARLEDVPTQSMYLELRRALQNCTATLERLGADRLPGLDAYSVARGWPVSVPDVAAEDQRIAKALSIAH